MLGDFSGDSVITNTSVALNGKDEFGNTNRINAEINLNSREKSGMMVELRDCWATPNSDPYNNERVVLIRKGCPVNESFSEETLNVMIHNSGTVGNLFYNSYRSLFLHGLINLSTEKS